MTAEIIHDGGASVATSAEMTEAELEKNVLYMRYRQDMLLDALKNYSPFGESQLNESFFQSQLGGAKIYKYPKVYEAIHNLINAILEKAYTEKVFDVITNELQLIRKNTPSKGITKNGWNWLYQISQEIK